MREPYSRVLIVCEGEKTEPIYFIELRDHYRLNTANIEIAGRECGSSPDRVVEYAKRRYKEEAREDPFDKVFCVFDKDCHESYARALDAISREPSGTFEAIPSVPCFEYWFLLHYKYTTSPYEGISGGNSPCDNLTSDLRTHIPEYGHGTSGLFFRLKDDLGTAKQRARRALHQAREAGTDNPSTRVHLLVHYLQHIK